ncbi:MAG: hypothetical protein JW808_00680 [Victivallales bacterium]|nr:hypothetical protein [Victivallales bacterium]
MKVFCVLNPLSGSGACLEALPVVERVLNGEGVDFEVLEAEGDISDFVMRHLGRAAGEGGLSDSVVAGFGGDGTQDAIINGMMRYAESSGCAGLPSYSIIPLGTGNNIAKSFGWELCSDAARSVESGLLRAVHGKTRKVDLGKVRGRWFLDAFSVGIDAYVLAARNNDVPAFSRKPFLRQLKGYPLYFLHGLKGLFSCPVVEAKISVDSKSWYEGPLFNFVVNNTPIYAGELEFDSTCLADDGLLDAVIFPGRMAYMRGYAFSGRNTPRCIHSLGGLGKSMIHTRGRLFEVALGKPLLSQVSGEVLGTGSAFRVETSQAVLPVKF